MNVHHEHTLGTHAYIYAQCAVLVCTHPGTCVEQPFHIVYVESNKKTKLGLTLCGMIPQYSAAFSAAAEFTGDSLIILDGLNMYIN